MKNWRKLFCNSCFWIMGEKNIIIIKLFYTGGVERSRKELLGKDKWSNRWNWFNLECKRTASGVSIDATSYLKPLIPLREIFDLQWRRASQDFALKQHRHLSASGSEAGASGVKDDRHKCGLIPLICLHAPLNPRLLPTSVSKHQTLVWPACFIFTFTFLSKHLFLTTSWVIFGV